MTRRDIARIRLTGNRNPADALRSVAVIGVRFEVTAAGRDALRSPATEDTDDE